MSALANLFLLCLTLIYSSDAAHHGASVGTVRLVRDNLPTTTQAWSSGIVQIYYDGEWGNICNDDIFSLAEANVICNQLGYDGAMSFSDTGSITSYGTDTAGTAMDQVSCSQPKYMAITQCSFNAPPSNNCSDNTDVTVECYSNRIWDAASAGDIRLTGGTYSNMGLLEIYCNDEWGTVCDDTFNNLPATVACRQLGFNSYHDYDHLSITGSGKIWLSYLTSCTEYAACLTNCNGCATREISSCSHSEDVTLECEYDSSESKITITTDNMCNYYSDLEGLATAIVIGIVIASIVCCIVCILIATVPFCICCCLGVGIGAASRSSNGPTVVTTTTAQDPSYPTKY